MPVMPMGLALPGTPIQCLANGKAGSVGSPLKDSLPAGGAVRRTASVHPPEGRPPVPAAPVAPAAPVPAAPAPAFPVPAAPVEPAVPVVPARPVPAAPAPA